MNFFEKVFDKRSEQFFAGLEVTFDGSEDCEKFMQTQGIDRKTAMHSWSAVKLTFQKSKLLQIENIIEGKSITRKILESEKSLSYKKIPVHSIHDFMPGKNGSHQLGGEKPINFKLPDHKLAVSFQYLGFIDNKEKPFTWLPFKIHLTCPIFLNFEKVFLDYTDPQAPVLVNEEELLDTDSSFDELNKDSVITYAALNFTSLPSLQYGNGIGHSGVPQWLQWPDIPRCPKTNRIMRFVCQFNRSANVAADFHNIIPEEQYHLPYFEKMNFWSDGDLYIFFEPGSKICCYIIQNT